MYFVVIDTSNLQAKLALWKNEVLYETIFLEHKEQCAFLLPALETLLQTRRLSLDDLSFIGVCIGPGSFTGTRIGVITAKTLSFAKKIPLISFDALLPYSYEALPTWVMAQKGWFFCKKAETIDLFSSSTLLSYEAAIASPHREEILAINPSLVVEKTCYSLEKVASYLLKKWPKGATLEDSEIAVIYKEII